MFHAGLWKLFKLLWFGQMRRSLRGVKTLRGLFHLGFVIAMMLYGFGSLYFTGMMITRASQMSESINQFQNDVVAVSLFIFTMYAVLFSTGESTIYFTPSEVAFLFPAPLTRKQLLTYKLMNSLLGALAISTMMTLFASRQLSMFLPHLMAVFLTFTFLQLLIMNVAFIRQVIRDKLHRSVRLIIATIIGVSLLVAVKQVLGGITSWELKDYNAALHSSFIANGLLAPFQFFVHAVRAPDIATWLWNVPIVLLVDIVLLMLAYRLDALSLETALATSEKVAARMKKVQTQGPWQAFVSANSSVASRRVPQLPYWMGIGPIVWQKLTTTFRSSDRMIWVLLGTIGFASWIVYAIGNSNGSAPGQSAAGAIAAIAAMGYLSFLLSLTMQHDIERAGYFKSLPISTMAFVVGELLAMVFLVSAFQNLFLAGVICFFPQFGLIIGCAMFLFLPLNFVMLAADKLIFYIYPTRMAKGAPGDFQNSGRQMIYMALKMFLLGGAGALVVLAVLPGALLFQSPLIAAIGASIVLGIECVGFAYLLRTAFLKFDPSTTNIS